MIDYLVHTFFHWFIILLPPNTTRQKDTAFGCVFFVMVKYFIVALSVYNAIVQHFVLRYCAVGYSCGFWQYTPDVVHIRRLSDTLHRPGNNPCMSQNETPRYCRHF